MSRLPTYSVSTETGTGRFLGMSQDPGGCWVPLSGAGEAINDERAACAGLLCARRWPRHGRRAGLPEREGDAVRDAVTFFVPGVPQPGGSKKGFPVRTKGGGVRIAIVEDAKHNAPWRAVVALAARDRFPDGPLTGPLSVSFSFAMPRPGSHYGSGRNSDKLKESAPPGHTNKPDITKLVRSTEDALTGIAWVDDSQIVSQSAGKMYTNDRRPGCWIMVRPFEPTPPPAEQPALFEERL